MSLLPPILARPKFWLYLFGNTPAICLSDGLPGKSPADILLLGCGDVRNLLFTIYADDRPLDFTCCDAETTVLARNILILSLILDDKNGQKGEDIWRIYYHFYITEDLCKLVQAQAKKLFNLLDKTETWNSSKYGKTIQFCNTDTENRVRDIFSFYATKTTGKDLEKCEKAFSESLIFRKKHMPSESFNHIGLRAGAPAGIGHLANMTQLSKDYWAHGTSDPHVSVNENKSRFRSIGPPEPEMPQPIIQFNPMFSHPSYAISLHYGSQPFQGFHATLAFVQIEQDSPLWYQSTAQNGVEKLAEALRMEFCTWAAAFKRSAGRVKLRLFNGDALAFAHTLHHVRFSNRTSNTANWYRDREQFHVLRLDSNAYGPEGSAPLVFDVIDTSNLQDHLGMLNILTATSKLLAETPSARITTEMMVPSEPSHNDAVRNLLCGDFISVAALLGLTPVEYCTDSAGNPLEDNIISGNPFEAPEKDSEDPLHQTRLRFAAWRMTWKRPPNQGLQMRVLLQFTADDLAKMLFAIYLKMFEEESSRGQISLLTLNRRMMNREAMPRYHRGTLATFLAAVRENVVVDWKKTMKSFQTLVVNDRTLVTGRNYVQELIINSHTLGLFSTPILRKDVPVRDTMLVSEDIPMLKWRNLPRTVYITMEIPRHRLACFKPGESLWKPYILQCSISHAERGWRNDFCGIQIGFGKMTATGRRTDDTYTLHIANDDLGWNGTSPLLVSFMVPTWMLLLEGLDTCITLHVRQTLAATLLAPELGFGLEVLSTDLRSRQVHITRYPPNQQGPAILHHHNGQQLSLNQSKSRSLIASVSASTDGKTVIKTIKAQLPVPYLCVRGSGLVTVTSPWNMQVKFEVGDPIPLDFPVPINESSAKVSLSKDKQFIQVEASVSTRTSWMISPCPIVLHDGSPVNWHMPYLKLDALPAIQVQEQKLDWLDSHLKSMFTGREQSLAQHKDWYRNELRRQDLKAFLADIFTDFAERKGESRKKVFILRDEEHEDSSILFPSKLRLDLSGRSVVLDTAVLPVYPGMMRSATWYSWIQDLAQESEVETSIIPISKEGMVLWKQLLPSWIERCRTWEHQPGCAYKKVGKVPISLAPGQKYLCKCGHGRFPANFVQGIKAWDRASRYASRAAISPLFPSRLVGNQTLHASSSRMGIRNIMKALLRGIF